MITIQHEGSLTIVGVFARLDIADFKRLEGEIESQLRLLGHIDLLVDLRGMLGYTLDVAFEDFSFTRAHSHDVGRVAILSEDDAVVWTALLSELFVRADIQVFDDETLAREWLAPGRGAEKRRPTG
jgi:SpoIIAA-like